MRWNNALVSVVVAMAVLAAFPTRADAPTIATKGYVDSAVDLLTAVLLRLIGQRSKLRIGLRLIWA
jgi:hypothetical protein